MGRPLAFPPGMTPGAAPALQVSAPLNDLQLIALMLPGIIEIRLGRDEAALRAMEEGLLTAEEFELRRVKNPFAYDEAINEAIEVLGALVALKVGLRIQAVKERVEAEIETARRESGEKPEPSSIIADGKAPH